jgi:hypothetical protein
VLKSRSDLRLLADNCREFLAFNLAESGRHLALRSFIIEMETTLRTRLGVTVDRGAPEALLKELQQWQPS